MSEQIPLNIGICTCIQDYNYYQALEGRTIRLDSFGEGNYLLNPVEFAIKMHSIPEQEHDRAWFEVAKPKSDKGRNIVEYSVK